MKLGEAKVPTAIEMVNSPVNLRTKMCRGCLHVGSVFFQKIMALVESICGNAMPREVIEAECCFPIALPRRQALMLSEAERGGRMPQPYQDNAQTPLK